ncbi:hypothetical protein GGR51DRAFT_92417 [Nemania sp. FL0031]|nr:hypothetical protein GGR51DRAFT_92417 [Nemania sp. FL0031]
MVTVAVEPPSQVQKRTVLYPPLVVMSQTNQYAFYQVVLMDSHGHAVESDILQGTLSASPQPLEGAAGRGRSPRDFAVFPDLVISRSGTYSIQVNAFQIDFHSIPPTTLHAAAVATREIRVRSSPVSEERPSSSESRMLARLSQGGFPIP